MFDAGVVPEALGPHLELALGGLDGYESRPSGLNGVLVGEVSTQGGRRRLGEGDSTREEDRDEERKSGAHEILLGRVTPLYVHLGFVNRNGSVVRQRAISHVYIGIVARERFGPLHG